jgi:F5/8 type C domain/Methyltransferase domain
MMGLATLVKRVHRVSPLLESAVDRITSWLFFFTGASTFRRNLALRRPATQSSVSLRWSRFQDPEQEARGANNGVVDGTQGFTTDEEHLPWWQVDLGSGCYLHEIRIFNRRDWAERLNHFMVLSSLDGKSWIEVFRKVDDGIFGDKEVRPFIARLPERTVGRFVRIQLLGTDYLHFNECQVFGAPADATEQPRIDALFRERWLAEQARLEVLPVPALSVPELDAELAISQYHYPFPQVELTRTQARRWILEYAEPGGIGAEVGVFRGHFSEVILGTLAPRKFYLIDPWEKLGKSFSWSDSYTNEGSLPTRVARRDAELRSARYPQTETVFIEDRFPDCKAAILEPLDWIYIDASHQYQATLREIAESAELLKPGGVIFGDDFYPDRSSLQQGVFHAVNSFVKSGLFEFVASGPSGQWCIRRTVAANEAAHFEGGADKRVVGIAARATGQQLAAPGQFLGFIAGIRTFRSVVSFGCGRAGWLHAARSFGAVEIRGYDDPGLPAEARGLRAEEFFTVDLGRPIAVGKRFDLAICVDGTETLPADAAETLARTLCGAADWVLFSASVPFQHHGQRRNELWIEYWAGLFGKMGFICYDILRMRFWHDTRIPYYYRQGACLYVRKGTQQALTAKGFQPTERPPALIHPELLLRVSDESPPVGYQLGAAVQDYYRAIGYVTQEKPRPVR